MSVESAPAPKSRCVAVLTHTGRDEAIKAAARLICGLSSAGITSVLPQDDVVAMGEVLAGFDVLTVPESDGHGPLPAGCELLVVLGGDGTILRGAEYVIASDIPLLGVNLGHVGFLAEAESSEIDAIVDHIVRRSYTVEERFTIDVTVHSGEQAVWSSFAINEVSVEKAARERMLDVMLEVDERPLSRWSCDGVLISTPTGSTAYAFSAGGPVIWPAVDAILVLPLSAHALFARPLVLGPDSHVVVEMLSTSRTHGVVWCDGRRFVEVIDGQEITIGRGRHRLRLARLSQAPFTDRLVHKFALPVHGWRGAPGSRP